MVDIMVDMMLDNDAPKELFSRFELADVTGSICTR
jgi:hypothetical protein